MKKTGQKIRINVMGEDIIFDELEDDKVKGVELNGKFKPLSEIKDVYTYVQQEPKEVDVTSGTIKIDGVMHELREHDGRYFIKNENGTLKDVTVLVKVPLKPAKAKPKPKATPRGRAPVKTPQKAPVPKAPAKAPSKPKEEPKVEYTKTGRSARVINGKLQYTETGGFVFTDEKGGLFVRDGESYKCVTAELAQESTALTPEVIGTMPPQATQQAPRTDLERADFAEAADMMSSNSDMTLQYSAVFKDKGAPQTRSWLGINAWKLGYIEGYIKQGFSSEVKYTDRGQGDDECRVCLLTLSKGDQTVIVEGSYTKKRLRWFLDPAKAECFDTFAYRNALKKIVSLHDVVRAAKNTMAEMESMELLPTKEVTD